ncbi:MAG TPA: hypothetical protein VG408_06895 [Actinomycetota bacterium]|nr:hypothetical protein [Actinomycetota bacterium]
MDKINIRIPASPEYVQVVRLVASGLANRLKFTLDDIEDLKIAVDELCAYLTGAQGRDGEIEIVFTVGDNHIEIMGSGRFNAGIKVRTELTQLSQMILDTVVDRASLDLDNGSPTFSLAKTKTA